MPHAPRPGFDLHYQTAGASGSPVVLIMGFTAPGRAWRALVPHLQDHHRLAWFDHRGVGDTGTPPGPYTMADLAGDVLALMDHLDWPRAHIVGLSMGGMVAQHVALAAQDRVLSLSLLATHAGGWRARLPKLPGIYHFFRSQLLRDRKARLDALAQGLFSPEFLASCDRAALEQGLIEDFGTPVTKRVTLWQYAAIQGHNTASQLPQLTATPALVLRPGLDVVVRPDESDRLAQLLPLAKLVRLDDSGHAVSRQAPDRVAEALLGHFAAVDGAPVQPPA